MNTDQFANLLDRHGARPERWPASERKAAQVLLNQSDAARQMLEAAQAIEEALGGLAATSAPADLSQRIINARTARSSRPGVWRRLESWFGAALWRPALAASIPLAFGFLFGLAQPVAEPDSDLTLAEQVSLLPFSYPTDAGLGSSVDAEPYPR